MVTRRRWPMRPTELLQEIRKIRFDDVYEGWNAGRLTQAEAAQVLGVCRAIAYISVIDENSKLLIFKENSVVSRSCVSKIKTK
jgi:hypothetical protein